MGLSGSGKSWLAARLAPLLNAIHLQSDVERRRLAGLAPGQASGSGVQADLYAPEVTDRVYTHLAHCAHEMLGAGWSVIVDATFSSRDKRAQMRALANRMGVPLRFIDCQAPVQVLRRRVAARATAGTDASEANVSVLEWQLHHTETVQPAEGLTVVPVDTAGQITPAAIAALARRCGG